MKNKVGRPKKEPTTTIRIPLDKKSIIVRWLLKKEQQRIISQQKIEKL